jgi:hypothetical protein
MTADTTSSLSTYEVVCDAIDVLNDGHIILCCAEVDYVAAAMLQVLVDLHRETALDLEVGMGEVREFARLVLEGWPL